MAESRTKAEQNARRPQLFKKGQSGNPAGKKVGTRDRRTVILDALKIIAEKKDMDPEELETLLQASGIKHALKGSFSHWQAITDGLYGRMTDKIDVTSKGRTLAEVIALANGKKGGTDTVPGKDTE